MKKYLYYFTCLTFLFLILGYFLSVRAQKNVLLISPSVWEIRMKPGVQYRLNYVVSSPNPQQQYIVRVVSIKTNTDGSLSTADPPSFVQATLAEGEWGVPRTFSHSDTFGVVISTDQKAATQDVYLAVAVESLDSPVAPGSATVQIARTTLLPLYISILGSDQRVQGDVSQLTVGGLFHVPWGNRTYVIVDSFLPIPLEIVAVNKGRHFFTIQSRVLVQGKNTKQSILLEKARVLAGSTRTLRGAERSCRLWYCPEHQSLILRGAYFGAYDVRVEAGMGVRGQSATKTAYFIALPFMHIIGVLLLLLIAIVYKKVSNHKSRSS